MPPAGAEGPVPSTLGRYRVDEQLGAGGMGVVYKAFDPELRRSLAIKVVRSSGEHDLLDRRARLHQEAATMAALAHRNVCQVFDVGTHDEQLWVAMELIHGETMRSWLRVTRSREAVLDVVAQICAGLNAAHSVGICHRDVKPDNVLVEPDGRAVLCDFGLSRRDDATSTSTVLAGTLAYMAPELLDGGAPTARTDQFAVAVLVHEALTGNRPRYGIASTALPAGLRAALTRALAADPAARFASVAEFATALMQPTAPSKPRRRRVLLAVGITAVAGVAIAAGLILTRGNDRQPAPAAGPVAATAAPAPSEPPSRAAILSALMETSPAELGARVPSSEPAAEATPSVPVVPSRYSCDEIEASAKKIKHPLASGFGTRCRAGNLSTEALDCFGAARTEDAIDDCAQVHLSISDMLDIGLSELKGAFTEAVVDVRNTLDEPTTPASDGGRRGAN